MPPKGTRTPQPLVRQALREIAKESIVTKRVPFGELLFALRNWPTRQLTDQRRESFLSAFRVSCLSGKGLRQFPRGAGRSRFRELRTGVRSQPWRLGSGPRILVPKLSDSRINRHRGVNKPVGFGRRNQPLPVGNYGSNPRQESAEMRLLASYQSRRSSQRGLPLSSQSL